MVNVMNVAMSSIENGLNRMIRELNNAISEYNSSASELGGPTISYVRSANIGQIPIPKLATGAVLPANRPFLSVVGDQKHGTNVEAPLDTIKQALREVQVEGNTSRPTNLTIECDKRVLGKLFVDLGNEESRRVGSKFVTI